MVVSSYLRLGRLRTVSLRQIPPGRSGSQDIEDAIQYCSVVSARRATTLLSKQRLDHRPFVVAQIKSCHTFWGSESET